MKMKVCSFLGVVEKKDFIVDMRRRHEEGSRLTMANRIDQGGGRESKRGREERGTREGARRGRRTKKGPRAESQENKERVCS